MIREVLTGDRISLRRLTRKDSLILFRAIRDSIPSLHPWMPWATLSYQESDTLAYLAWTEKAWEDKSDFSFGIFDNEIGNLTGGCGLNQFDWLNLKANAGYWVTSARTGSGIATEAARLVVQFGFSDLGLHRIEILASSENLASLSVARKTGAAYEARLKDRVLLNGKWHDGDLFSLINPET
ncbi:MAG: GNAT family N-acetyltransferase [Bacteroidetes bacterium]|nr:GNAT family N-acetyltransferase [Bacteroidota bacterium]